MRRVFFVKTFSFSHIQREMSKHIRCKLISLWVSMQLFSYQSSPHLQHCQSQSGRDIVCRECSLLLWRWFTAGCTAHIENREISWKWPVKYGQGKNGSQREKTEKLWRVNGLIGTRLSLASLSLLREENRPMGVRSDYFGMNKRGTIGPLFHVASFT